MYFKAIFTTALLCFPKNLMYTMAGFEPGSSVYQAGALTNVPRRQDKFVEMLVYCRLSELSAFTVVKNFWLLLSHKKLPFIFQSSFGRILQTTTVYPGGKRPLPCPVAKSI
jgi:hypothetical protein